MTSEYEERKAALEKIKRREQRLEKEKADATVTIRIMSLLGPLNALLILIPVFTDRWINTSFTGFGVSMLNLRTSLFMVDISVACGKNYLEDKICHHVEKFSGVHQLSRARDTFCAVPGAGHEQCNMIRQVFMTSFIIFFFFTMSAGFHMFSSAFLYYYWEAKPLPQARRFAMICYYLGPLCAATGLMGWTLATPDLTQLMQAWTASADALTGGIKIFSVDNVHTNQFGRSWFGSVIVVTFQMVAMLIWPFFFTEHPGEEAAVEEEDQLKSLALSFNVYEGGADYGSMAQSQGGYGNMAQGGYGNMQQPQGPGYNMQPGMQQQQDYASMQQQQGYYNMQPGMQGQPGYGYDAYAGMQQQQMQQQQQGFQPIPGHPGSGENSQQGSFQRSGPQRGGMAQAQY